MRLNKEYIDGIVYSRVFSFVWAPWKWKFCVHRGATCRVTFDDGRDEEFNTLVTWIGPLRWSVGIERDD